MIVVTMINTPNAKYFVCDIGLPFKMIVGE